MFERCTERARQVVVLAQDEARALKHNYIGTEHILLGLLREHDGIGARALESCGITIDLVQTAVKKIVGVGEVEQSAGQLPFTPRAKKVMELSLREALSLGHNYIGTEHILLAIARENEGVASRILNGFAADPEVIRNEVIRLLSGRKEPWNTVKAANEQLGKPELVQDLADEAIDYYKTSLLLLANIKQSAERREFNNVLTLSQAYREIVEANKL